MLRKFLPVLIVLAALVAPAALAQVTATIPVTCAPGGNGPCLRALAVVNPDGTSITGGATGTQNVTERGGSTILAGQVSVGTSATLIAAARTGRQKIGVTVTTAVQCAFGPAGVSLATGWPLAAVAYAADNWDTSAALYGICASTATIGWREQY